MWYIVLFLFLVSLPRPCVMPALYDIIEVKAGEPVTLPCAFTCPAGQVQWKKKVKDDFRIAVECALGKCTERQGLENRTELSTVNISLTIKHSLPKDEGMYFASCDDKEGCDVKLKVVPHQNVLKKSVGTSASFPLFDEDPVQVILTTNSGNISLCILDNGTPHLNQDFWSRLKFINGSLVLHNLAWGDSGVITVMNYQSKETISTCNLSVFGTPTGNFTWMIPNRYLLGFSHSGMLGIGFVAGILFKKIPCRMQRCRIRRRQSLPAQDTEMDDLKIPINPKK